MAVPKANTTLHNIALTGAPRSGRHESGAASDEEQTGFRLKPGEMGSGRNDVGRGSGLDIFRVFLTLITLD